MVTIEEFAKASSHQFNNFESKMASAYRKAIEDLESAANDLGKTVRTEQVDDQSVQYFLPEYENPLLAMDDAERRLAEISSDIENFMDIVGSHSRRDMAEMLHRCRLDIEKAKRQARNILKKAILDNPSISRDNVEKLGIVQAVFAKRDNIIAELKPIVADLTEKLRRAEKILEKYG